MARARDGSAFANGFEGESWMNLWCSDGCTNDTEQDCPLVLVAMLGRTPAQWEDKEPGALNRYVCHEYTDKEPG